MPRKKRPQLPGQFAEIVPNLAAFLHNTPFNRSPKPDITWARTLMDFGNWEAAYDVLLELHAARPKNIEVLDALAETAWELGDLGEYEWALMQLNALQPNDPACALELAEAHVRNGRMVMGLNLYRRFVERWPRHEEAAEVQALIAEITPDLQAIIETSGIHGPDIWQWAAKHEEIQLLLDQGDLKQARTLAENLLKKHPSYLPALNNLSLIHWLDDQPDQAIATAQRALTHDDQNVHALANLTRFLFLRGDQIAAQTCAAQLRGLPNVGDDGWAKQAEALSYLGDDAGVLAVFAQAKKGRKLDDLHPLLHHLAAVAQARQGDEAAAKRLWTRAKKLLPLDVIEENLENLRQPASQRHAPWPFNLAEWINPSRLIAMTEEMSRAVNLENAANMDARTARFLARNQDILALIPSLLDRGDPAGCELACNLAATVRSPELLDALQSFAFGQRGSDGLRYQAALALKTAGRLTDNTVHLWVNRSWQDIMLLDFEIYTEAELDLPPEIATTMQEAINCIEEDPAKAMILLREIRDRAPDAPSIPYNLSVAYLLQGRTDEAAALVREVAERFPDYFFAQVALARLSTAAADYDAASALLKPLITRGRFHFNEATALFDAQIGLLAAQGQYESIKPWLEMWRGFDPEHPSLQHWEQTVELQIGMARLLQRSRKKGR
jgi:tetratricopeptide (TPR) repeat protein